MQSFIVTLLICSLSMSALALLYMTITPLLEKRYSVTSCYYAWFLMVLGLIIPFRPQFRNAIVKVDLEGNMSMPIFQSGNGTSIGSPVPMAFPSSLTNISWTNISWWQIAAAVWLAGMIIFLSYHLIRHYRFLKLTARWSENITDEQILMLFKNLKVQMGISQTIGLQICESIDSPMMTGFVNSCILLPRADFANEELYLILKHELVHYKRKDLWYKCMVLIASAIHWFNPIVHLMAKAISLQCELSCDAAVVRNAGAETRQYYSETIIDALRYQAKRRTLLSTNFYGGKKDMKKRIFSIMDRSTKRAGVVVLFCALGLTLGTGFAFAAKRETQSPEMIEGEDTTGLFGYSFQPNPEIYSQYSSYGITISDDGEMLLYNGQRVRLFVDEHSDTEAFFLDQTGVLDLCAIRNASGNITGIESISKEKAQEYRSAFFANDTNPNVEVKEMVQETVQDITGKNKLEQYLAYGITLSDNGEVMYYNGQRVKLFVDKLSDGNFETFWIDEMGMVNLSAVRNEALQIISITSITEEQAQKYNSVSE